MLPKVQDEETKKNHECVKSERGNLKAKEAVEAVEEKSSSKSTTFSNDMLHMLMSEVRLQNTEMRLSLMKIHEKLDKYDGDGSNATKTTDVDDAQIKKTMNR